MANTKTSALTALTGAGVATTDLIPIDDVSVTTLKNITIAELAIALTALGNLATDAELSAGLATKQDSSTAATDAELAAHTGAAANAHTAAAIGVVDVGAHYAASQLELVLDEVGDVIDILNTQIVDHVNDTTGAHSAASIANTPAGSVTATDVQAAINQLATLISGGGIPATIVDAAGDLILATADNTVARKAKGANYSFLGVDAAGAVNYGDPRSVPQVVNTQTGTSYTLVLTDAGKLLTANNAGAITVTVPPAASVAFAPGTIIDVAAYGAGQVTIAPGAGVTIRTSSTLKLRTQWSTASLVLSATTNEWLLVGDLEPLGQTINNQTGTTYTLTLADAWGLVTLNNAGAIALTIPANASVAFAIGTHIDIVQLGAGQVTTGITSDTLRSTPTAKLRTQYSMATLVKIAATTWVITGDMATS